MNRVFTLFEEIETDLALNAPTTVYKYRTWNINNHKNLLINQNVWFPHPFDLNDSLDVRPETIFIVDEFHSDKYFQKLLNSAKTMRPDLTSDEQRLEAAKEQWESTKNNPEIIVEHHREYNTIRTNFDQIGVFSTSMSPLIPKIWEEYGDNHKGYCIGFNTVELCRQMKSGYGYVRYCDEPYQYSFLNKQDDELDTLYLKKTSWKHEDEFRFITVGIGIYSNRCQTFKVEVISEVIYGYDMAANDERDILNIINTKYPKGLPIYKIKKTEKGGLVKEQIQ